MRRRRLLLTGGAVAVTGLASAAGRPSGDDALLAAARRSDGTGETEASTETILADTVYETTLFVRDAGRDGPTAMVFGGVHGDERNGIEVAREVADWHPDAGRLVVVPETNRAAVDDDSREGPDGDLNRHFPAGEEPASELARGIWDAVARHEPDVVLDLHRSLGLAAVHPQYVGQAVFHSADARGDDLAAYLNEVAVPWAMPFHRVRARETNASGPLLFQKAIREFEATGYLFETTEFLLDRAARNEVTRLAAAKVLAFHGLLTEGGR
ncbi:succinylglutamate desuccinylase/aspartoacylase family protein [Natrinema salifodinae]|uniref:Succinylglutamate desuccinylase / Aspartoacylase family protein n=1 Tax=Natrinema salifodinae TaxID=1202768 RepID=A0A1I0MCB0_9EURY|nr:succinylglutamate desuccinylase/aspartoacylase family protein [Natrinema salifodinae]SEV85356.1 Succinylglutamate desuccinylase / Aspartoacylase family protein [Natrinema salifodinae]